MPLNVIGAAPIGALPLGRSCGLLLRSFQRSKFYKGLTLQGLRPTVATILRENGVHPRKIAEALGQQSTAMAIHYSRTAYLMMTMAEASAVLKSVEAEARSRFVKRDAEKLSNNALESRAEMEKVKQSQRVAEIRYIVAPNERRRVRVRAATGGLMRD